MPTVSRSIRTVEPTLTNSGVLIIPGRTDILGCKLPAVLWRVETPVRTPTCYRRFTKYDLETVGTFLCVGGFGRHLAAVSQDSRKSRYASPCETTPMYSPKSPYTEKRHNSGCVTVWDNCSMMKVNEQGKREVR